MAPRPRAATWGTARAVSCERVQVDHWLTRRCSILTRSELLSNRNTAAGKVKNEYPELDNPAFRDAYTVTGNRIKINPKFTDDKAGNGALADYARTKFPSDTAKQMRFLERFKSLRRDALLFVDEDEE